MLNNDPANSLSYWSHDLYYYCFFHAILLSAQLLQIVCPKLRMVLTSITQVNLILITIKNYILFGVSSHSYEIQGNRHVGDLWQPEILGGV